MLLVNVRFVVIMLMLVSHSQFLFSSPPRLICMYGYCQLWMYWWKNIKSLYKKYFPRQLYITYVRLRVDLDLE